MEPRTSHGQMVSYYLKMEPHLFRAAVEDQFARIRAERDAAAAAAKEQAQEAQPEKSELMLYRRAQFTVLFSIRSWLAVLSWAYPRLQEC